MGSPLIPEKTGISRNIPEYPRERERERDRRRKREREREREQESEREGERERQRERERARTREIYEFCSVCVWGGVRPFQSIDMYYLC